MKKIIVSAIIGLSAIVPLAAFASTSITLQGANPVTVWRGSSFVEPGYTANSTVDGNITNSVTVTGADTSKVGTFDILYSVTDSVLSTASAIRGLIVQGLGNSMIYCSGPMAPGWHEGVAGGGCGGTDMHINAGQTFNGYSCPNWYTSGCMVPTK